ncbi:hypothetical protein DPMN_058103 [Dreissena polymorpha]|uniref:DED domain-containing protein n=1 Tax=Dreissena polymorpha TaxID=45954 RepID=A0A9D4C1D5_DREPO|nr:hypothetical protein DPMN_058103 [Dreissena polymorpha]
MTHAVRVLGTQAEYNVPIPSMTHAVRVLGTQAEYNVPIPSMTHAVRVLGTQAEYDAPDLCDDEGTSIRQLKLVLYNEPDTKVTTKALQSVNNAFDVLMLMVNRCHISDTDLTFLADILTQLSRKDLVSDIHTFINHTVAIYNLKKQPKTLLMNKRQKIFQPLEVSVNFKPLPTLYWRRERFALTKKLN